MKIRSASSRILAVAVAAATTSSLGFVAAAAFTPNAPPTGSWRRSSSDSRTGLRLGGNDSDAGRREFVAAVATAILAGAGTGMPKASNADIDYDKVQDLLGDTELTSPQAYNAMAGKRPTYLTEPTEEFKENEAKAAEFKREQLKQKKVFMTYLEKMQTDPNDEKMLAGNLDNMRRFVQDNGGLPLGITKEELVKQIRRRKSKKFWPTNVEIAYQDLINEIMYQQSPNTDTLIF